MAKKKSKVIRPGVWSVEPSADERTYCTILRSSNGKVLQSNCGFNNRQNALNNIRAVARIASISPVAK